MGLLRGWIMLFEPVFSPTTREREEKMLSSRYYFSWKTKTERRVRSASLFTSTMPPSASLQTHVFMHFYWLRVLFVSYLLPPPRPPSRLFHVKFEGSCVTKASQSENEIQFYRICYYKKIKTKKGNKKIIQYES